MGSKYIHFIWEAGQFSDPPRKFLSKRSLFRYQHIDIESFYICLNKLFCPHVAMSQMEIIESELKLISPCQIFIQSKNPAVYVKPHELYFTTLLTNMHHNMCTRLSHGIMHPGTTALLVMPSARLRRKLERRWRKTLLGWIGMHIAPSVTWLEIGWWKPSHNTILTKYLS